MALTKRDKRSLMILGGFLVLVVLYFVIFGSGDKKPPASQASNPIMNTGGAKAGTAVAVQPNSAGKPPEAVVYKDWGRDPFNSKVKVERKEAQKAKARAKSVPVLKVQAIFWREGKPFVLVNDEVMGEGQQSNGIRIEKIESDKVQYRRGGRTYTALWRKPS